MTGFDSKREAAADKQKLWDKPSVAFDEWWNGDNDESTNPFRLESGAYWAWAGWKAALAQPVQEPVAWKTMEAKYPSLEKLDIRMGDGSILCDVWPQSDGDFWWAGSGTGEKFIDPKYANVTHWRIHAKHTAPPQREWVGLTAEEIASIPLNEYTLQTAERLLKEKNT